MIDSSYIKELIYNEVKDIPDLTNVCGIDLTKCLIKPTLENYESSMDSEVQYNLWTVLEESKNLSGYRIYYDPEEEMFGLSTTGPNKEKIDAGQYGTFLEALNGM